MAKTKKENTVIKGTWEDVIKASVKGNPKSKNMSSTILQKLEAFKIGELIDILVRNLTLEF